MNGLLLEESRKEPLWGSGVEWLGPVGDAEGEFAGVQDRGTFILEVLPVGY